MFGRKSVAFSTYIPPAYACALIKTVYPDNRYRPVELDVVSHIIMGYSTRYLVHTLPGAYIATPVRTRRRRGSWVATGSALAAKPSCRLELTATLSLLCNLPSPSQPKMMTCCAEPNPLVWGRAGRPLHTESRALTRSMVGSAIVATCHCTI